MSNLLSGIWMITEQHSFPQRVSIKCSTMTFPFCTRPECFSLLPMLISMGGSKHNQIISFFLLQIAEEGFGHILKYIDNYFRNIYVQLVQVPLCREEAAEEERKLCHSLICQHGHYGPCSIEVQELTTHTDPNRRVCHFSTKLS